MVTAVARGRCATPGRTSGCLLGLVSAIGGVAGLCGLARFPFGALQVGGDRLGLGPAAARTAAALLVATVARGLGAALRAVGHRAFLALLGLLAHRRLAPRLGDR